MEFTHISHMPDLDHAVMVAAFGGWNDAASAATWAVKYLISQWDAQPVAEIDSEPFFDFTEARPQVRIQRGVVRQLVWPSNRYYVLPKSNDETRAPSRDVILLLGEEPQLRWRTFAHEIVGLCEQVHVEDVILLGSLVAEVPHTRPVQISGTSSRAPVLRRMDLCGVERASYKGATGLLTVVQDAAQRKKLTATSLWGVAPHYISATPNLAVSEALLRTLEQLYHFKFELKDLARAAQRFTARVSSLVADDPDVSAYVQELELRTGNATGNAMSQEEPRESLRLTDTADTSGIWQVPIEGELPSPEQAIRSAEDLLRQFREGTSSD